MLIENYKGFQELGHPCAYYVLTRHFDTLHNWPILVENMAFGSKIKSQLLYRLSYASIARYYIE